MIDILSEIKGGTFVTVGYLCSANIGKTLTGKNIDVEKFGQDLDANRTDGDDEIYSTLKAYQQRGADRKNKFPYGGIVKFTKYLFHFQNEELYGKNFGKYADARDKLLARFGASINKRDQKHDEKQPFGKGSVSVGATDNTIGKLYTHQNAATIQNYKTEYFVVDNEGELLGGISGNAIKSLLSRREPDGVSALRAVNATDEQIKEYIEELKKLKFSVLKLMYDSILFIVAAVNGEKIYFVNTNLQNKVGSGSYAVPINPESFEQKANEMFKRSYNEINECVNKYNLLENIIFGHTKKALSLLREGSGNTDYFEEYEQNYPNDDFDVSNMTPEKLARWCDRIGDFLYIYNGLKGLQIMVANDDDIVSDIINDLHNCEGIEPTHEVDDLLRWKEKYFIDDYVCVFKIKGTHDGDYYIIYQENKHGGNPSLDESKKVINEKFQSKILRDLHKSTPGDPLSRYHGGKDFMFKTNSDAEAHGIPGSKGLGTSGFYDKITDDMIETVGNRQELSKMGYYFGSHNSWYGIGSQEVYDSDGNRRYALMMRNGKIVVFKNDEATVSKLKELSMDAGEKYSERRKKPYYQWFNKDAQRAFSDWKNTGIKIWDKDDTKKGWREDSWVKQNADTVLKNRKDKKQNENREMKQTIRLKENQLKQIIAESVRKVLNEGMYGYPDDCDQIILSYEHDRECMSIYEDIMRMLLKKHKRGVELSFDTLVNSSVMKKFQQFVFRKFKKYQDGMTSGTPYSFREYVANRMIEDIRDDAYSL